MGDSNYKHRDAEGSSSRGAAGDGETSGQHAPARGKRKINRTLPQLARNAACVPCRRRRVKCDGARPTCSSCVRSYHFLARTQPDPLRDAQGVQCVYEEDEDEQDYHSSRRRTQELSIEKDPRAVVSQLEAKVAELQNALLLASRASSTRSSVPPVMDSSSITSSTLHSHLASPHYAHDSRLSPTKATVGLEAEYSEIYWPGWPKNLPSPAMLEHLIITFFGAIPSASRLLHRETFMARAALPPRHSDFPHPALLHAICAVGARYTAAVRVRSVQEIVERGMSNTPSAPSPGHSPLADEAANETCFAERHFKFSQLEIRYDNCPGAKLVEILQAQVVLIQYISQTAKWLEGWVMIGAMTRTAIALGLLDEGDPAMMTGPRIDHSILLPPTSDREREERRALAAEVVAIEAAGSVSGNWPGTLPSSDELHFRLPAGKADFMSVRSTAIPENPQWINDPDLYTSHPVEDSYVMYLKGSVLLARVSKFVRMLRRKPLEERTWQSPDFIEIDRDLNNFSNTFPVSLRDPLQPCPGYASRIDTDLINAHLMRRVAAILLHEPFASLSDPECASATRILVEAKSCLGVLYLVMSTTTDMAMMLYPITSVWLYHACRTMVLFYHRALETGDRGTARTLLSEIEVFQTAFAAIGNRFSMGAIHCGQVDAMIQRIHEEFGLPPQKWHWSPQDWDGTNDHSSALNYKAGMRSGLAKLPLLPATHPDGMAWGEKGRLLSYRQIFDQQRAFVGKSPKSRMPFLPGNTVDASSLSQPTLSSIRSMGYGSEPEQGGSGRVWRID